MSPVLRFEDFAAPPPAAPPGFTAAEMAEEYRRGHEDGAAAARRDAMTELTGALRDAMEAAGDEAAIRRRAVRDTLSALTPVMQALAAQLGAAPGDRLTGILTAELERLCLAGIAPTCRIAASARVIERVGSRIGAMGLQGVTLLPDSRTEITFDGGRIAIDLDEINGRIAGILAELSPQEE